MKSILKTVEKARKKTKMAVNGKETNKPCLLAGLLHDPKIGKKIEHTEKRYKSGVCGAKRFPRLNRLVSKLSAYNSFKKLVCGEVRQDITSSQKLERLANQNQAINRLQSSIER